MIIGYARVSSDDQSLDLQRDAPAGGAAGGAGIRLQWPPALVVGGRCRDALRCRLVGMACIP